ncbi:MAG: FKBP-type peptidyl-prolyl cis-trans isomerase [Bacteroidales bacterium]|jgi:FKBP-type peptidyl-prolyl cis-trans isomerase FklB|nr:FKBP-type peptidyl-prolyl cis-trans isomerase [Bacteroidales bacterium]
MLQNDLDKASYGLGLNIASSLQNEGVDAINAQAFAQGISDFLESKELQLSVTEASQIVQSFLGAAQQKKYEKNITEAQTFLAENAKREGVIELPSGLQYEIITEGSGEKPSAENTVTTHYHGTLINGETFDSSVQRNEPATFPLNGVIKGWTEALQLMPVGSKWKLYVPSELAYGTNPHPNGPIEPHQALIFEVELLEINK